MPKCTMMVGLPGSGKSTWLARNFPERDSYVLLSTDNFIEHMAKELGTTYNAIFKDQIKAAETHMKLKLELALTMNKDIIWDQTNLTAKTRKKKLAMLPDTYEKHAAVFIPDHNMIVETNELRKAFGRALPEHVIRNMEEMFQMPVPEEGFSKIFLVQRI